MNFHPTSFFILENVELGTFWISQTKMRLGANGQSLLASITINQLIDKLVAKYVNYDLPCIDVVSINKNGFVPFYGLERWLSKLDYKIKQSPKKYEELDKLLKAGWHRSDTISHSKINVLQAQNPTDLQKLYKRLISDWEAKGLRCLNALRCKTDKEKYEDKKKDPEFLYKRARKEVLRQMKKTGKMPKDATLEKYQIKEEEVKECMGRKGIIYKITSPSGKVYVGQTIKKFNDRISQHKSKYSNCTLVKRAIDKYKDQMKYEIIEDNIILEHLDEREIFWIKELNSLAPNGYNLESGGNYKKELSDLVKDNISKGLKIHKINRDGYLGYVIKRINGYVPRVKIKNKYVYLSQGVFNTEEEAIQVLKEYTGDPDNFIKINSPHKRKCGSISKIRNRWKLAYKNNKLGSYATQEEAQEALERYLKDPENFTKPERITTGHIFKRGNRWNLRYNRNFLGSYDTEKEAREALERYREDPDNFVKPQKNVGCVRFDKGRWKLTYKNKYIGYYATKEEAEEALQSSIYTSSSEMA